VNELNEEP